MENTRPLSEGSALLIERFKDTFDDFMHLSIAEKRNVLSIMYLTDSPKTLIRSVIDRTIESNGITVPIRTYQETILKKVPVLVYFHGGGWVLGDLNAQDPLCRLVASQFPCAVISVDYRLAPENKYPAAVEDGLAVLQWIISGEDHANWDKDQIVLAGDSAGGNLSAVVGKQFNRKNLLGEIVRQVMIYPVTDLTRFDNYSYNRFGKNYLLDQVEMVWYSQQYLEDEDQATLPSVSPLLDTDFTDYPATVVITAGYDVLRDEGIAFAEKMKARGLDCELVNFDNLTHSFLRFAEFDENAKLAIEKVIQLIGSRWNFTLA